MTLVAVEAAAVLAVAVGLAADAAVGSPGSRSFELVTAVLALTLGLGLGAVAAGLRRARRWARGPAVAAQLLCVPAGAGMIQQGTVLPGVLVLALAGGTLWAVVTTVHEEHEAP